ncbi:MAG: permease [Candidatus Saganbacteria bacterium]|nr:permease [Candidatus Saganbacteria bacterium]
MVNISLFVNNFIHYVIEVLPALILGFFISGLIHEFLPDDFVDRYLAKKNFLSILWATLVGVLLPICCIGNLPVAISFYKRGARLGPVLAFLVATPATSITALLVTYRLLGLKFTIYIFFAAIVVGLIVGLIGNLFPVSDNKNKPDVCPQCKEAADGHHHHPDSLVEKMKAVLIYSFWKMPREIGLEIIVGLVLAALVVSMAPLEDIISTYLSGAFGYVFALPFAIIMYICSTATVPLVDALVNSGMNIGAGMLLLLVGPITSFGTLLVVRKEFGNKVLWAYLTVICLAGLILGYGFSLIY